MMLLNSRRSATARGYLKLGCTKLVPAVLAFAAIFAVSTLLRAQTTISTGSIQGMVTNPTGGLVSGAKITITNKATGQVIETTTNSAGTYISGALGPGSYTVRIEVTV